MNIAIYTMLELGIYISVLYIVNKIDTVLIKITQFRDSITTNGSYFSRYKALNMLNVAFISGISLSRIIGCNKQS